MPNSRDAFATGTPAPGLGALVRPIPVLETGAPPPDNSEIRKIADDIAGALQYSFAAVAANPDTPVRPDSVESVFRSALQAMPKPQRDATRQKATELVQSPTSVRTAMFGRSGALSAQEIIGQGLTRYDVSLTPLAIDKKLLGVRTPQLKVSPEVLRATPEGLLIPGTAMPPNFEDFRSQFEEASRDAEQSDVNDSEKLRAIWGPVYQGDPFAGASGRGDDFEDIAVTDRLGLWITKVRCVDETSPEGWGSDEIALAGVSVDETGDTDKIPEKKIGGGFDDGDSKSYPDWRYATFSLREGEVWPKAYSVTLILAEKDHGGLSSYLNVLWLKVKAKVDESIKRAVTEAMMSLVGPAIAKAIGEAVAWVVNKLVDWFLRLFRDDIFHPFTAQVTTPSMNARWNYPDGTWGNPSSGVRTAHFYGFGGLYTVDYYWKFYA